ncbi:radical SAM protein [Sandaracinus amylolyticus]|uniref:Molybdenum cofactor biosynthesis protein MoaA n=1 Tax=Sandaracinus amylolyticus TaxID=927083 RepID=A0A0F6YKA0_9BACT|nr:radical SAM protein [Sandaracinus amylolyticus]AKF07020.1 Molybdenum cofactor biosynthesis protein MoaA [Sandaracinus amylolyticus]
MKPLDHPYEGRPHRVYATLTNHCNRSCPWCSTCSSPRGSTFLMLDDLIAALPEHGAFEVQLEGGEPTTHPEWLSFVDRMRAHPRCTRVVLCTNGAVIPRDRERLRAWIARLGAPITIKLSVNHHLLEHDPGLVALARSMRDLIVELGADRLLVLNVRRRRGVDDDDARVVRAIEDAGLLPHANVFFLQRYGFARDEASWEPPHLVGHDFRFVSPDGRVLGPDLIARSEAMRVLR